MARDIRSGTQDATVVTVESPDTGTTAYPNATITAHTNNPLIPSQ